MSLRERLSARFGRAARPSGDMPDEALDPVARREFLRRALDENLLQAVQEGEIGPGGRAGWLAEHLEIYVNRCVGFAALPSAGAGPVLGSSFFWLVEIGTEALRRELEASPPAPGAGDAWRAYLRALESTGASGDFESLATAAGTLRAALGGADPYGREHV